MRQQPLPRGTPNRLARHHGPALAHRRHLREHAGRPGVYYKARPFYDNVNCSSIL